MCWPYSAGRGLATIPSLSSAEAAHATTTGYIPIYYAKLTLILAGMLLSVPIRAFVDRETSDSVIPASIRTLAAVSLVVWIGVIATGRWIAYAQ